MNDLIVINHKNLNLYNDGSEEGNVLCIFDIDGSFK